MRRKGRRARENLLLCAEQESYDVCVNEVSEVSTKNKIKEVNFVWNGEEGKTGKCDLGRRVRSMDGRICWEQEGAGKCNQKEQNELASLIMRRI